MSDDATLDGFVSTGKNESDEIGRSELIQGVAWSVIDSVPEEWAVNNIESDIEILSGDNFSSGRFVEEEGIPLIRIRDLAEGETTVNFDGEYDSRYLIHQNDLLVGMDGEFEPHLWAGRQALLNQRVCKIEPKSGYNKVFFRYAIEKPLFYIQKSIAGTTVKHLSQSNINDLNLPTPPLSEQRKIATVLYTVDRAIEKTEKIIGQTRHIKRGVMHYLFEQGYDRHSGYDEVRIGPFTYEKPENWDICSIEEAKGGENGLRRGPFGGMLKKDIFVDSGYKVYQQQNVIYDDIEYGHYYITDEKFRDMERFRVSAGDILISCSGTLGKVAVVPANYEEGVINQALLKFTVDTDMFQKQYMKYFLESKIGQRQLVLSSRGSAMKNMAPMEFVRSAQIFKPPIDEQSRISDALLSLDETIMTEKVKKEYLEQLQQGLMQDLLLGTVRTADASIEVPEEVAQHG